MGSMMSFISLVQSQSFDQKSKNKNTKLIIHTFFWFFLFFDYSNPSVICYAGERHEPLTDER